MSNVDIRHCVYFIMKALNYQVVLQVVF